MDPLPSHEEVEIPMPINSAYVGVLHGHGHGHHGHDMTHHHHNHNEPPHIIPSSSSPTPHMISPSNTSNNGTTNTEEQHHHHHHQVQGYNGNLIEGKKKVIRYKECQKNHAASMGGSATDGCGEFMPSGEEGTIEALICSACNCHRNFHRKEVEGEQHLIIPPSSTSQFYPPTPHSTLLMSGRGRKVILGSATGHHVNVIPFSRSVPINMAYQVGGQSCSIVPSDDHSDDHHHHHHHGHGNGGVIVMRHPLNQVVKKRFRTKFSQEQKEKMMEFAEKVGWKIQKQEESVVQQFCQEIGVNRRVLKVWMHNNKHSLANKSSNNNNNSSSSI